MIRRFLYMILAAALLCACQMVSLDDLVPGEETIDLKASGEVYKFQFTAKGDWTAKLDDDSWCKISPIAGSAGDVSIKISPSRNFDPETRVANLIISCLWDVRSIRLVQAAAEVVNITPKEIVAPAEGGTFEISIEHNVDVTITAGMDDWYTVSTKSVAGTKALDTDLLEVNVQPSRSGWPREGAFTLSSSVATESIKVYQEAANVFSLSVYSIDVPFSGGPFSVDVSAPAPYHINSMPDWVQESSVNGTTHTFKADANGSDMPRDGIIVFCDEGGVCLPLTIRQGGRPSWADANIKHNSLMMRFTATWCGWCPMMNESVKKAQELYPDHIIHLALHGNSSDLYFSQVGTLMTQYLIQGYPTGIVDGRIEINNGDVTVTSKYIVNAAKETASLYGTASGASVESSIDGKKVNMDMTLYFKTPGDYKLTVLLVEDNINNAQADYVNGDHSTYIHNGVARLAVTPIEGTPISVSEAPSTQEVKLSATIDGKWNASNIRILGYIHTKYGSRTKKRSGNYGDYFIDNCFLAVPGQPLALEIE